MEFSVRRGRLEHFGRMSCYGSVLGGSLWQLCGNTSHGGRGGSGGPSLEAARLNRDGAWPGWMASSDGTSSGPVPRGAAHGVDVSVEPWPGAADEMASWELACSLQLGQSRPVRQGAAVLGSFSSFFSLSRCLSTFPPNCSYSILF